MVEGLLLSLPKRPDILAIQLAASFILLVLLAGVMFLVSPLQVAVSVAAILTVIYFFTRPTIALFSIFCIRGLLDLLWWIPGTIAGLNMLQLFSAAAFCLVATQLFLDLKRMQEHPLFQMFLAYLVFIIIGTLRSDNILANLDNIVRYTSPFILFFMVSIYLDKRELRRSLLFFIACIGIVPMSLSLYHLASGQMNEYTLHGYDRLMGAYKNLHTMALMSLFFLCVWVFWLTQVRSNFKRLVLLVLLGLGTLALYKSYIRTGLLGLAIFLSATLFFRKQYRVLGFAALMSGVAIVLSPDLQDRFSDVFLIFDEEQIMLDKRMLGSGRWGIWTTSMRTFLAHPPWDIIFGAGMGEHLNMTLPWVEQFHARDVVLDPHNDYLLLLYQIGPFGMGLYLLMQIKIFLIAVAVWRNPQADRFGRGIAVFTGALTLTVIMANGISNSFIHRTSPGWYYWCICGLLVAEWATLKRKAARIPGDLAAVEAEAQRA